MPPDPYTPSLQDEVSALRARVRDLEAQLEAVHQPALLLPDDAAAEAREETHEHLRLVMDAAGMAAWSLDEGASVGRIHTSMHALFDLPQAATTFPRHMFQEMIPPEDWERLQQQVQQAWAETSVFDAAFRVQVHGEERWYGARGRVVSTAAGGRRMLGVTFDLTDHRLSERALRESEERLRVAKDAADLGIFDYDVPNHALRWDARVHQLWGVPEDDSVSYDTFLAQIHPSDRRATHEAVERALHPGGDGRYYAEYRVVHRESGVVRWVAATGQVTFDGTRPMRLVGTVQDITARRQTEAALRESESAFRAMADTAPAMLWVTNPNGYCTFLSRGWYAFTGQTEVTGLGTGWTDAVHPNDRAHALETFLTAIEKRAPFTHDYRLRRADGTYRWAIDAGRPRFSEDGTLLGYVGSVIDITERKRAEEALREARERLQNAVAAADIGTWRVDLDTGQDTRDATLNRILGFPPTLTTQPVEDFFNLIHPDDQPAAAELWEAALNGTNEYDTEHRIIRPDGDVRWLRDRGRVICDETGRPLYVTGAVVDTTERKRAVEQLHLLTQTLEEQVDARTEQVRNLASALTLAEQRERQRIAQMLHDHLQQLLYGTQLKLHLLRRAQLDTPQQAHLDRALELLEEAMRESRSLTVQLNPPLLREAGLEPALEWLAEQIKLVHDVDVTLSIDAPTNALSQELRSLLFQLTRELLFNVVKHAGTDRARITLRHTDGAMEVTVIDDGIGFDVQGIENAEKLYGGYGLHSVRERLTLIGGHLNLESHPRTGTRATVVVPV